MGIREEASNIVVDGSIQGSVFPKNEKDILFPVLLDGSNTNQQMCIEGAVYGRAIEIRGGVNVYGPIVSRGDTKLNPSINRIFLAGGITVNGILNGVSAYKNDEINIFDGIENVSIIIRGDISVNQNISLNNAIVFGSIRAVNCKLQNCIVLGTVIVQEKLTVSMSSIGGYVAHDIIFEGSCMMIHALGESVTQPIFSPYESLTNKIIGIDIRYYPSLRESSRLVNLIHYDQKYPEYSKLNFDSDWTKVFTSHNPIIDLDTDGAEKWILSLGGRIGNFSTIQKSIKALCAMLKCGFEYDHLNPLIKKATKENVHKHLNKDEQWILDQVCN